jgi:thioredoxin-like negative regulator of GroEL
MQKVLLIFLICSALAFVESKPNEKNMDWWTKGNAVIYKSNTFEEAVGKDKDIVVQFCAQFSADCHNIVTEYEKLVELYTGDNAKRKDIVIAKLDGWTFNAIPQEYGIRNFPEIVIFKKGSKEIASKFEGEAPERTAEKMSEWIEKTLSQTSGSEKSEEPPKNEDGIPQADRPAATGSQENNAVPPPTQQQQTQEPAKPAETQQTQQTQQTVQTTDDDKKELKLVLNTTLLQGQFDDLTARLGTIGAGIKDSESVGNRNFEELKGQLQAQRQEITNLQNTIRTFEAQKTELNNLLTHVKEHSSRIDLLGQGIANNKKDLISSVQESTQKSLEEVRSGIEKIRNKVSEPKAEAPKESGMGGITMLLIGAVIGGAVGFVVAGLTGKKSKKGYLLD